MRKTAAKAPVTTIVYQALLAEVKERIRQAQNRAAAAVNSELVAMYWDIGRILVHRQQQEGWGAGVLKRLSNDLKNEFSDQQGFSERNLKLMTQFHREYPTLSGIGQQAVAQLATSAKGAKSGKADAPVKGQQPVADIAALAPRLSWTVNVLLLQRVKDLAVRKWYMCACIEQGWGRDVLAMMIQSQAHKRQGASVNNFDACLPAPHSELAKNTLKDPYIFDFLTLDKTFREQELEAALVAHLERFLLELGAGFAFVGRQVHLDVAGEDFYIDLLFYHLRLRSFVVIELKTGPFKPEYAGKINFYCNIVDEHLRHVTDNPTIGLILCQDKKRILAEYALRGMKKPIGVSEYELTRALPKKFKSMLPSIEAIEAELSAELKEKS